MVTTSPETATDPKRWNEAAYKALCRVAESKIDFTTDDVWSLLAQGRGADMPAGDPRIMGAVLKRAEHAGLIKPTDRVRKSGRVECHHRPVRVWKSLIFKGKT